MKVRLYLPGKLFARVEWEIIPRVGEVVAIGTSIFSVTQIAWIYDAESSQTPDEVIINVRPEHD